MGRTQDTDEPFYLPHDVGRLAEKVAMTSAIIIIIKQAFSQTDNVKVPPGSFSLFLHHSPFKPIACEVQRSPQWEEIAGRASEKKKIILDHQNILLKKALFFANPRLPLDHQWPEFFPFANPLCCYAGQKMSPGLTGVEAAAQSRKTQSAMFIFGVNYSFKASCHCLSAPPLNPHHPPTPFLLFFPSAATLFCFH